jgi:hypothetical protein
MEDYLSSQKTITSGGGRQITPTTAFEKSQTIWAPQDSKGRAFPQSDRKNHRGPHLPLHPASDRSAWMTPEEFFTPCENFNGVRPKSPISWLAPARLEPSPHLALPRLVSRTCLASTRLASSPCLASPRLEPLTRFSSPRSEPLSRLASRPCLATSPLAPSSCFSSLNLETLPHLASPWCLESPRLELLLHIASLRALLHLHSSFCLVSPQALA